MKTKLFAVITLLALCFTACDDNTEDIGQSLTSHTDRLNILTDTFIVKSRSIVADSVLSRSDLGYLGKIKDPETGDYITGDFMVQFNILENNETLPVKEKIVSKDENDEVMVDSCEIRLFFDDFYGDSLAAMKLTVMEMDKPMRENVRYYSNFNPYEEGYIRENGINKDKVYTIADKSVSDSIKSTSSYTPNIRIKLNEEYTDKDGKTYNNYGTYIMRKYYEHPEYFKNSYSFISNVCPGFYIKTKEGIGSMAYISISQLNLYFKYQANDTTVITTSAPFSGTEEVLQTTTITNDKEIIRQLASDNTCTYLKTPAGIFTEIELPVDDIFMNHKNDTLNTAEIALKRINNNYQGEYSLYTPESLLMIPRDSLYTFFEHGNIIDNKTSYLATDESNTSNIYDLSSNKKNLYTFNNISSLVTHMAKEKAKGNASPNWNKVVIVPVKITTSSNSSSSVVKISHDMSLTSVRLVGGSNSRYGEIQLNAVYSKFSSQ